MIIKFPELKKYIFYVLIASLIVAACFAVITVLVGHFNELSWRVIFTLFSVMFHSLFCLCFVWDDDRKKSFERLEFFFDSCFMFIVLSFIVSTLGIWKIFSGFTVSHLYQSFFVIAFAILHGEILFKAYDKEEFMNIIIYVNIMTMLAVVLMLVYFIFSDWNAQVLGDIFLRLLAALAIIDATLTILTIIFYRIYLQNHPEAEDTMQAALNSLSRKRSERRGLSVWVWLIILYMITQGFISIGYFIFGRH